MFVNCKHGILGYNIVNPNCLFFMSVSPNPATKALIQAVRDGELQTVRSLIDHSDCNCRHHGSQALREAVKNGQFDMACALLPHSNPTAYHCGALAEAASLGRMDLVVLLLPYIDPSIIQEQAVGETIIHNHREVFDLLLPRVINDSKVVDLLIRVAAQNGREYMLEQLLPHCSNVPDDALIWAVRSQSLRCVELLQPLSVLSHDFYAAWRNAFVPFSPDIIEFLMPHVDVNMFSHVGLATALLENNIPLAQKLFERSNREKVFTDVQDEVMDLGRPVDRECAIGLVEQWLNEEQAQRIHGTLDIGNTIVARRKI